MKVIVTGATGLIGGGALQSALDHPDVTSVIVLVRRETGIGNSKLTTIIKTDFTSYEPGELEQLKGADGCIWALGSPKDGLQIHQQYPRAALSAFSSHLAEHTSSGRPFRFVLLSGAAVITNQRLWLPPGLSLLQERGKMELEFADFAAKNERRWQSFVARPAMVLRPGASSWLPGGMRIETEVLGAALVDAVVSGWEVGTMGNGALKLRGEEARKLRR